MNTSGDVRLVRRLTNSGCREGVDWGVNRNSIWVDNGCRAVFESDNRDSRGSNSDRRPGDLPTRVTCESSNNRRTECSMNTRGNVRLVRRLSDRGCREGADWGVNRNSVWVDNGCRAVFELEGR